MTERPRWWLMAVAALMAALFLYQSIGLTAAILLASGFLAGSFGWRWYCRRTPASLPGVRCLNCGETLASTARNCKYCGSARWTVN